MSELQQLDQGVVNAETANPTQEAHSSPLETDGNVVNTEPTQTQVPADEKKTSDFKQLREHKKQLEAQLRQQAEELAYLRGQMEARTQMAYEQLKEPTLEDFGGDAKAYAKAYAAYEQTLSTKEQEKARKEQATKEQQAKAQVQAVESQWAAQVELAVESDQEAKKAVEALASGVGSQLDERIIQGIKRSVVGVELMKYIGLNPAWTAKLETLPAQEQATHMAALERMAMARGGNLSHLRGQSSSTTGGLVPPAQGTSVAPPPKVTAPSAGAPAKTPTLSSTGSIKQFRELFKQQAMK